jgi:uncharacterized YigZ family protein
MTIIEPVKFELEVRRSRFHTHLEPAVSKDQALLVLERVRAEHWEAVHHCFAWRLGVQGVEYRMSDDGEPAGTAGKPMLFVLQQERLTNVIAVVARYFGGVKLGTGPLARAYADATRGAIRQANLEPLIIKERLVVHCLYEDVARIIPLLEEVGATFHPMYGDAVTFEADVPVVRVEYLKAEIVSRTNARAGFSKVTGA